MASWADNDDDDLPQLPATLKLKKAKSTSSVQKESAPNPVSIHTPAPKQIHHNNNNNNNGNRNDRRDDRDFHRGDYRSGGRGGRDGGGGRGRGGKGNRNRDKLGGRNTSTSSNNSNFSGKKGNRKQSGNGSGGKWDRSIQVSQNKGGGGRNKGNDNKSALGNDLPSKSSRTVTLTNKEGNTGVMFSPLGNPIPIKQPTVSALGNPLPSSSNPPSSNKNANNNRKQSNQNSGSKSRRNRSDSNTSANQSSRNAGNSAAGGSGVSNNEKMRRKDAEIEALTNQNETYQKEILRLKQAAASGSLDKAKLSQLQLAVQKAEQKAKTTFDDLEKKTRDHTTLDKAYASIRNSRDKLEEERDKYKSLLYLADQEKMKLTEKLSKCGGAGVGEESDASAGDRMKQLETENAAAKIKLEESQRLADQQTADIEYYIAQVDYLKVKDANHEADIAILEKKVKSLEEQLHVAGGTIDSLQHQASDSKAREEAILATKDDTIRQLQIQLKQMAEHLKRAEADDGDDDENDDDEEEEDDDDDDEDVPWLYTTESPLTENSIKEIAETLHFETDAIILDVIEWHTIMDVKTLLVKMLSPDKTDEYVEDVEQYSAENISLIQIDESNMNDEAVVQSFWKAVCSDFEVMCKQDILLFITNIDSKVTSDNNCMVRCFISVLNEAFSECKDPGKTVVVLVEYKMNQVGGEDATNSGITPSYFEVVSFEEEYHTKP